MSCPINCQFEINFISADIETIEPSIILRIILWNFCTLKSANNANQCGSPGNEQQFYTTSLTDQWTYHHYNTATTTAQLGKLLLLLPKLPTIAAALAANSSRQRTPSFDRAGTSPRTHEKIQNNNKRTQLKKSIFKIIWIPRQFYPLWKQKVASFQALMRKPLSLLVLQFCAFWYFCAKICVVDLYVFDVALKIDQKI